MAHVATVVNWNVRKVPTVNGIQQTKASRTAIDAGTRQGRWISAGHDPPITYDPKADAFAELEGGDLPLGVDADWQFEERGPVELRPGQIILLGTDGIWECRSPHDRFFGKDALREIIRRHADAPAEQISQAITNALADFRKDRAQEDESQPLRGARSGAEPLARDAL